MQNRSQSRSLLHWQGLTPRYTHYTTTTQERIHVCIHHLQLLLHHLDSCRLVECYIMSCHAQRLASCWSLKTEACVPEKAWLSSPCTQGSNTLAVNGMDTVASICRVIPLSCCFTGSFTGSVIIATSSINGSSYQV